MAKLPKAKKNLILPSKELHFKDLHLQAFTFQQFYVCMKTKLFICSSGNPAVMVKSKLLAGAIMEIDSGPDIFVRISAPRFLQVTTPFSGILGQDLNLPWFQSFQVKPGCVAV